ncbi:MAG: sulfite exporter TauE/SafE family protein [Xanthobacteraceae bacterium]
MPAVPDLSALAIVYCCAVIVISYAVRGSTGFGAAAAMPLLALALPIKLVVPLWTLLGITSSLAIVARDWRYVAVRDLLRTLPAGLLGIAIGLYAFASLDARTLARGLGVLVIVYGGYTLWLTARPQASRQLSARIVAPIAGVLGGAVGTTFGTMASLFYAIYFDAIRMAKENFRATMSAMILTLSIARGIGYAAVGEFGLDVLAVFAVAFPMMLAGIIIGDRFHAGMSDATFRRVVGVVLIVSGVALVVK